MKLAVDCSKGDRFAVKLFGKQKVFFLDVVFELLLEKIFIQQVTDLDAFAVYLITITWPYTPACSTYFLAAFQGSLLVQVQGLMVGHDQVCVLTDHEPFRGNRQTRFLEFLHFCKQHFRVYDHPVSDHAFLVFIQDAGGDKMKNKLPAFHHQCVSRIITPLEADDTVCITGKHIDDLALTLITPLGAYHYHIGHLYSPQC